MALSVLIVDDSATIRQVVRSCLEQNSECFLCSEADDGETAIEFVRKHKPHAVVLDFSMPKMHGLDVAQNIANVSPTTRVVLFTAHDSKMLRIHAAAAGVKAVIAKDGKASLDALQQALRGGEPRAA